MGGLPEQLSWIVLAHLHGEETQSDDDRCARIHSELLTLNNSPSQVKSKLWSMTGGPLVDVGGPPWRPLCHNHDILQL